MRPIVIVSALVTIFAVVVVSIGLYETWTAPFIPWPLAVLVTAWGLFTVGFPAAMTVALWKGDGGNG